MRHNHEWAQWCNKQGEPKTVGMNLHPLTVYTFGNLHVYGNFHINTRNRAHSNRCCNQKHNLVIVFLLHFPVNSNQFIPQGEKSYMLTVTMPLYWNGTQQTLQWASTQAFQIDNLEWVLASMSFYSVGADFNGQAHQKHMSHGEFWALEVSTGLLLPDKGLVKNNLHPISQ